VALLRHVVALLVGVVVALASVAVHRDLVPLGLLLAVVTTYAVAWWLLGTRHPRTAATYVAGWLLMFVVVVLGRPEGDYAIASDVPGYALVVAAIALVGVGVVGLAGSRRSDP
jgi:hypothetical protein